MNKLSKIAPIIVILACAGSLFFAIRIAGIKTKLKNDNAQLTGELDSTRTRLAGTEAQLKTTRTQLQQTEAELTQATNDLQATKVALDQKTQEADGLKTEVAEKDKQLQAAKTELASANGILTKLQTALKGFGVESIDQINQKVVSLTEENRLFGEQLRKMSDDNQQLKQKVEELTTTPVNLHSKVTDVQSYWNFFVLDVGRDQRVQPNAQFLVYRDSKPFGKAQIVFVGDKTSIAEMVFRYRHESPRVGDVAVH